MNDADKKAMSEQLEQLMEDHQELEQELEQAREALSKAPKLVDEAYQYGYALQARDYVTARKHKVLIDALKTEMKFAQIGLTPPNKSGF